MPATPPTEPAEGTSSGTLVVIALAVFCLLFVAASFINPADFMGEGAPAGEQAP